MTAAALLVTMGAVVGCSGDDEPADIQPLVSTAGPAAVVVDTVAATETAAPTEVPPTTAPPTEVPPSATLTDVPTAPPAPTLAPQPTAMPPTVAAPPTVAPQPTEAPPPRPELDASADLNCSDFGSHSEAQGWWDYWRARGVANPGGLDGDDDGDVCESL